MKQVPYHGNRNNACALACYTMAAQYLLPEKNVTFEKLAKLSDWQPGYIVWGFPAWKWLMDQGVRLRDYDSIDYDAWVDKGKAGLRESVPAKEFKYYEKYTYDMNLERTRIMEMYHHSNFEHKRKTPSWSEVVKEHNSTGVVDVTLNSRTLNRGDGVAVHRVVLLDITDTKVVFHDPQDDWSGKSREETTDHFRSAFESLEGPELCRYFLDD